MNLLPVVSPAFSRFKLGQAPQVPRPKIRDLLWKEIEGRHWWMLAAGNILSKLLLQAYEDGRRVKDHLCETEGLQIFFNCLACMAVGAQNARELRAYANRDVPAQKEESENVEARKAVLSLRNGLRAVFLMNLSAHRELFEATLHNICGRGSLDEFEIELLVSLAVAAMRALPGENSVRWINEQLESLTGFASNNQLQPGLRGRASMVLHFSRSTRQGPSIRPEIILPKPDKYGDFAQTLPFVTVEGSGCSEGEVFASRETCVT